MSVVLPDSVVISDEEAVATRGVGGVYSRLYDARAKKAGGVND
jgi:hypothetical protein